MSLFLFLLFPLLFIEVCLAEKHTFQSSIFLFLRGILIGGIFYLVESVGFFWLREEGSFLHIYSHSLVKEGAVGLTLLFTALLYRGREETKRSILRVFMGICFTYSLKWGLSYERWYTIGDIFFKPMMLGSLAFGFSSLLCYADRKNIKKGVLFLSALLMMLLYPILLVAPLYGYSLLFWLGGGIVISIGVLIYIDSFSYREREALQKREESL